MSHITARKCNADHASVKLDWLRPTTQKRLLKLRGRTGMLALAEHLPVLGHVNEEVAQSRGAAYLLESPGSDSQSVDRFQSRKSQFQSEHCSSHGILDVVVFHRRAGME